MKSKKWTWAPYGKKTIGIGIEGDGAVYMVNTRNHESNDPRIAKDMHAICAALNATDNWEEK